MSEITFFHGAGSSFEDGVPWKLPTLKLVPPVYDYNNLEYEETEVGRSCWDCDCLLSNFSKVLFDIYIKSKDDNHPHFTFCSLLYNQNFSHFLFKHFGTEKQSEREQQTHIFYLYAFNKHFLLFKKTKKQFYCG